jgi:hypothetical protein
MNGDWIAQDVEPDICCPDINIGCTCELERVHQDQIKKLGLTGYNIGWALDEIRGQIDSKVGFPDDPTVYIFTTNQVEEDTWVHSVDKYIIRG